MILMRSGEGKTDMGQMVPTDRGMRFVPGPMAWIVDRLVEKDSFQRCEKLEDTPGNDDSPNSLKCRLSKLIGHDADAQEQAEWVRSGKVDPERIDMPSFNAFRDELNEVLNAVVAG
jgi:hypothetical protein